MATETPEPPSISPKKIVLPTNPGAEIAYTYHELNSSSDTSTYVLIACVNSLGLPQAFWDPFIKQLRKDIWKYLTKQTVALFTYDRFGQGLSHPGNGVTIPAHDMMSCVKELDEMIKYISFTYIKPTEPVRLILVSQSIGVPLARLYCQEHPQTVSALLALDSNMANLDFSDILPDPDSPSFDISQLPSDTSVDQLRQAREFVKSRFDGSAPNSEGLDRSNAKILLPKTDGPKLKGSGKLPVLITVMGHDPDTFAEESLKIMPRGLTERYLQPAWDEYNKGLLRLGTPLYNDVVIAKGCGHFIQKDDPKCVADEVLALMTKLSEATVIFYPETTQVHMH